MKFKLSSAKLFAQLQALGKVIVSKNSISILDCVLFEIEGTTLTLTASDSETTMKTTMPLDEAEGQGKVAFGARILIDTLKEFPEQMLTFDIDDNNFSLNITSDNGVYSFVGVNGDEYPQMPRLEEESNKVAIPAETLLNAINRTIFCTADDELRPVMNGIYFDMTPENLTMVATDAHRLVRYQISQVKVDTPSSFILPKKPASLLRQVLAKESDEVNITYSQKNVCFEFKDTILMCRLIEGRFPNYNAVIPQNNQNKITVDRLTLLNAAKRVAVFANQGTGLIKLSINENSIQISAQDIDFSTSADETIACSYVGRPMAIGFKGQFLIEILGAIQSTEVSIELSDPSRAGLILPFEQQENENLVMLLMPMLLND